MTDMINIGVFRRNEKIGTVDAFVYTLKVLVLIEEVGSTDKLSYEERDVLRVDGVEYASDDLDDDGDTIINIGETDDDPPSMEPVSSSITSFDLDVDDFDVFILHTNGERTRMALHDGIPGVGDASDLVDEERADFPIVYNDDEGGWRYSCASHFCLHKGVGLDGANMECGCIVGDGSYSDALRFLVEAEREWVKTQARL